MMFRRAGGWGNVEGMAPRVLSWLVLLAGCGSVVSGGQPRLSMVSPGVACDDQRATVINLAGDGFSPLADENLTRGRVELPQITLLRQSDLDGTTASDSIAVPNDPARPTAGDETWTGARTMGFTLCPPGVCSSANPPLSDLSSLPAGLYTVRVTNRSGGQGELASALTVVPVPVLDTISPDTVQFNRQAKVTLSGDFFLRLDGAIGALQFDAVAASFDDVSDCRPLPSASAVKLEACKQATLTIAAGMVHLSSQRPTVVGPGSAGCHSLPGPVITFQ
jgi:hypothetical protein